jgi:hypothetical protein
LRSCLFTNAAFVFAPVEQLPFHLFFSDSQMDDICCPLVQVTRLDFAPEHAYSYNELIEVVKLNLLLADWNDEDHNESLLSVRNSKWGKEMLRNVR